MSTREAPPPPMIGKAGNLTVFITPSPKKNPNTNLTSSPNPNPSPKSNLSPSSRLSFNLSASSTPSPSSNSKPSFNLSPSPKLSPNPRESPANGKGDNTSLASPVKQKENAFVMVTPPNLPPVQVPPKQFEYEEGTKVKSHGSFGFFWDAVSRVQEAHSSLDEYLANWFGLDQSKYQWALNDYYETNPKDNEANKITKPKEVISKGQAV